ncbi:MAG: hypothetical protein PVSMB7_13420 [Chloroflexota bacterium]
MKPTPTTPAEPRPRSRKSIFTAMTLQCIPLLGAAGCASEGATNQQSGLAPLRWLSILFWGFSYLYLRRLLRFIVVCLVGPLFALTICTASLNGVTYDYEHAYKYTNGVDSSDSRKAIATANRASYQEALMISCAVLLLSVDAWRVVALNNARMESQHANPSPRPPAVPSSPEDFERPRVPADDSALTWRRIGCKRVSSQTMVPAIAEWRGDGARSATHSSG